MVAERERALGVEELPHRRDRGVDLGEQLARASPGSRIAATFSASGAAPIGAHDGQYANGWNVCEPEQQAHRPARDLRA